MGPIPTLQEIQNRPLRNSNKSGSYKPAYSTDQAPGDWHYNPNTGKYQIGPVYNPMTAPEMPADIVQFMENYGPTSPYGASGGGSQFVDTSAARNSTQAMIDSLVRQLANMNATAQNQYNELINQYNEEDAANKTNYENQVAKNEATRSGGISQALAAAAQGGRGLRSALAAMGALGGTGSLLANRAVAQSANKDIGGVNETFETNAEGLNTAWGNTEREQRQRRAEAEAALENARLKNEGSIAAQRQSLFKDMAGFWEQAGNKTEAANWLARIAGENPVIERASLAATPSFQRRSAAFSPEALKGYLAGNQDMSVKTSSGNSGLTINSPIYATRQRREEYA